MNPPDEDRWVPDGVHAFVREHIDRLDTLHVLLLLHGTAPRAWSVREVSFQRASSPYATELSLRQLNRAGLLLRDDGLFRFQPHTAELAEHAAWLIWWYQTSPQSVRRLIFCGGLLPN